MALAAYCSHQPVINRSRKIIAQRLCLHGIGPALPAGGALAALDECWPQSERTIFVGFGDGQLDSSLLEWAPPPNAMVELPVSLLTHDEGKALVKKLIGRSWPLALDGWIPKVPANISQHFRFIQFVAPAEPAALTALAAQASEAGLAIARGVHRPEQLSAALDSGITGAAGWALIAPGKALSKTLAPGYAQIVNVLNLVRNNAEIRDIEAALKQDVALSYQLLRHINSAGFGLSCEIQSFRHAVTILGYEKLNKWLSLLLVTASKDPSAHALMQTALARAHFLEALGNGFFDKGELDNLFIVGAFSLLDVLLGTDMSTVLEAMTLPEAVIDALTNREGVYAPFLKLVLACEGQDGAAISSAAEALQLSPSRVTNNLVDALTSAGAMDLGG